MVKLHLVGFSSDLKSLVFSTRRGAKSGTYTVDVNPRLKRTLEEIESRQAENDDEAVVAESKPARRGPARPERPSVPPSKISPKEIQSLLREGKTPDEVAQIAESDVSWIERFTSPIIAERAVVVDIVKTARIARLRRGLSSMPVGEAILANLADKKVWLSPEEFEEGWNAVRREGQWEVTFAYKSRGREMDAGFAVDHERNVRATNPQAATLGWRPLPGEEDDDEDLSIERTSPAQAEPAAPAVPPVPPTPPVAATPPVPGEPAPQAPPSEARSETARPGPQAAHRDVSPRKPAAVPAAQTRAPMAQRPGTPSGPVPRGTTARRTSQPRQGASGASSSSDRSGRGRTGASAKPASTARAAPPTAGAATPEQPAPMAPGSSARQRREPPLTLRPGQAVSLADVGWSLPADRAAGRPPTGKGPSGR